MQALSIISWSFIPIKAETRQIAPLSGAICGKLGMTYLREPTKKSGRFPTRFRRDQARQQSLRRRGGGLRSMLQVWNLKWQFWILKAEYNRKRLHWNWCNRFLSFHGRLFQLKLKPSKLRRYPVQFAENWERLIFANQQSDRSAAVVAACALCFRCEFGMAVLDIESGI